MPTFDFGEYRLCLGGPDEGFGRLIVLGEVAVDRRLEVDQGMEDAALQPALGEFGEEALDGIEPGGGGRGVVEGPALVPLKPGTDLGMFVRGVVVEDHVDQLAGGHVPLDAV